METEKKQHGGARVGAGRRKKVNSRAQSVALRLSTKAFENLQKLVEKEGSNKNDVINKLLESLF